MNKNEWRRRKSDTTRFDIIVLVICVVVTVWNGNSERQSKVNVADRFVCEYGNVVAEGVEWKWYGVAICDNQYSDKSVAIIDVDENENKKKGCGKFIEGGNNVCSLGDAKSRNGNGKCE